MADETNASTPVKSGGKDVAPSPAAAVSEEKRGDVGRGEGSLSASTPPASGKPADDAAASSSSSSGVAAAAADSAASSSADPHIPPESLTAAKRIFDKIDITHDGVVSVDDLQIVMKSLQLFPSRKKLKEMVAEVDLNDDGVIDFEEFVEMRRSKPNAELNVLAQFKKYDVSPLFRGFITEDSVRKVLSADGLSGASLEEFVADFMSSDTNGDGKVSFRDLFERMMGRVPDEWLQWIFENVQRGVSDRVILQILGENGFSDDVARHLLERTRREGRLTVERTYADNAHSYVYQVRT